MVAVDTQTIGADGETNPEKEKHISQVIDELGLGRTEKSLPEFLYNVAERIAELCYEVKQIKEKINVL